MIHVLRQVPDLRDLNDWGPVAAPIQGASRTSGAILFRDPGGIPESGLWECTPGTWACDVARAEFCYFVAGRCVYVAKDGETAPIEAGDAAWFPAGWTGSCEVLETVRKVYVVC